jgi:hypothetical protein
MRSVVQVGLVEAQPYRLPSSHGIHPPRPESCPSLPSTTLVTHGRDWHGSFGTPPRQSSHVLLSFGQHVLLPVAPCWHAATWHPKSRGPHSRRLHCSKKNSRHSEKSIVDAMSYPKDTASPVVEAAGLRDVMASPPGGSAVGIQQPSGNFYRASQRTSTVHANQSSVRAWPCHRKHGCGRRYRDCHETPVVAVIFAHAPHCAGSIGRYPSPRVP